MHLDRRFASIPRFLTSSANPVAIGSRDGFARRRWVRREDTRCPHRHRSGCDGRSGLPHHRTEAGEHQVGHRREVWSAGSIDRRSASRRCRSSRSCTSHPGRSRSGAATGRRLEGWPNRGRRVVECAPGGRSSSPGIARSTSSPVEPHRRCHGPTTAMYDTVTKDAAPRPTAMPGSDPNQMMSVASTMKLATTQPTRIKATSRIVRISKSPLACFRCLSLLSSPLLLDRPSHPGRASRPMPGRVPSPLQRAVQPFPSRRSSPRRRRPGIPVPQRFSAARAAEPGDVAWRSACRTLPPPTAAGSRERREPPAQSDLFGDDLPGGLSDCVLPSPRRLNRTRGSGLRRRVARRHPEERRGPSRPRGFTSGVRTTAPLPRRLRSLACSRTSIRRPPVRVSSSSLLRMQASPTRSRLMRVEGPALARPNTGGFTTAAHRMACSVGAKEGPSWGHDPRRRLGPVGGDPPCSSGKRRRPVFGAERTGQGPGVGDRRAPPGTSRREHVSSLRGRHSGR